MPNMRLTDAQLQYIKRIADPQTPADLMLALQNYNSPAFKEFANQVSHFEQMSDLVDHLLIDLANQQYVASEREKEAILQDMILREMAADQLSKIFNNQPPIYQHDKMESKYSMDELKERLEQRQVIISSLIERNKTLVAKLDELSVAGESNTKNWHAYQTNEINHYTESLEKNNIALKLSDSSSVKPAEMKKIVAEAFEAPAPLKVIEVIGDAWQRLAKQHMPSDPSNPPPPPPLPPAFKSAPVMAAKAGVLNEIRLIKKCAGSDESIASFLQAKKQNQAALRLLPKPKTDGIWDEAIHIYQDTSAARQELETNKHQLLKEERLQSVEQKIYDKLAANLNTPKL